MFEVKEILAKLNEEQIKPVLDTEGAVLVIAGAGSGKTRVLTSRIAYLVLEKDVPPSDIMAITFTNKAAKEMKERLTSFIGDTSQMWVSTIHSMCVKILRRDIDKIGFDKNFTIYDESDTDRAIKRVCEENGIDVDKKLKTIKNYISTAKNDCLGPEEFKIMYADLNIVDEIYTVYKAYDSLLRRSNSLDFDDLLFKTYLLFKDHSDVADYYAKKFRYVHIDEFQDTNKVQFILAQRLSSYYGNLFVVGDDDQSIYSWRGAKIENILNFDNLYKGAKIYKLERNYRSTKKILALANKIISKNSGRREKTLWTENEDGAKIEYNELENESKEASFVATQIKALLSYGYSYKDFAVFIRLNALTRSFEQEFIKYGIPYRVFGGFRFYERKEIKDILSYLKVIVNKYDDESFLRAVSTPRRGIGDKTLSELKEYCTANFISLYHGIDGLSETTISGAAKTKLENFKALIDSFTEFAAENSVLDTINHVIETTDFMSQFSEKTEDNEDRIMNIEELKNSVQIFAEENGKIGLAEYLNSVTLSSDTDDINTEDVVTLATIHAVKGLEFPCVFVSGLEEKILPISRSFDDIDELEEERRLMYVAVTRARERLYLTRAKERFMYGSRDTMMQSRFLEDAGELLPNVKKRYESNLYEKSFYKTTYDGGIAFDEPQSGGGYSSSYAKTFLKENKPVENGNKDFSGYKTGARVKHVKFGEGTVIAVKGEGENIVADVAFLGVGIKSLAVKFAPMELIK